MKFTSTKYALLLSLTLLSACSPNQPMRNTNDYAQLNCPDLVREKQAVALNATNSRDSGSVGVMAVLGYVAEGLAIGSGNEVNAQQMHESNQRNDEYRTQKTAEADAYDQRIELLDKIIAKRECSAS